MTVSLDCRRCMACGACVGLCPVGALSLDETRLLVDAAACTDCGICESACPAGALSLERSAELASRPVRSSYDVIVIGAGPAGAWAARAAAQAGACVLLLEKRQEIGSPVRCAEGVGRDALQQLMVADPRWTANVVERADITVLTGGEPLHFSAQGGKGYILERRLFDRFLAEEAAAAGAEIRVKAPATDLLMEGGRVVGVRARIEGTERCIAAAVVIGADGVESWVGRWAGLTGPLLARHYMTCAQYLLAGIEADPGCLQYWISPLDAPGGYVWLFPKGAGKANVGLGMQADLARQPAIAALNRFIESRPALARGSPVTLVTGGVPVAPALERLVGDGIMLVGDAARQVDPLTGGGIITAMLAGQMAGRVAAAAVGAPDREHLVAYEREWQRGPGRGLARNYRLLQRFPADHRVSQEFLHLFAMAAAGT